MLLNDNIKALKQQYNDLKQHYNHPKETPKTTQTIEELKKKEIEELKKKDYSQEFYAIISKNILLLEELPKERVEEAREYLSMLCDDEEVKAAKERWKRAEKGFRKFDSWEAKCYIDSYYRKESLTLAGLYEEFISKY
jgi:hypothetical protein